MLRRGLRGVVAAASALLAGGSLLVVPALAADAAVETGGRSALTSAPRSVIPIAPDVTPDVDPDVDPSTAPARVATPTATQAVGTDGRLRLAVLVPITVPASSRGLLDSLTLAAYTSDTGTLTRQLDAIVGHDVTIAIDPRIIASIRVLGAAAPPSAVSWLERLDLLPNEIFALAYADADPAVISQAGVTSPLAPIGFGFAVDPANFSPADDLDSDLPSLPVTVDDILEWNYSGEGIAWPRDDSVVAADFARFAAQGYQRVILTSANAGVEGPIATDPGGVSAIDAVVSDGPLSAALAAAAASSDADSVASLAALTATVAGAAGDAGSAIRVVSVGRTAQSGSGGLAAALDALDADPLVALVGLNATSTATAQPAAIVDMPVSEARVSGASRMLADAAAEDSFATVAIDPLAITASRHLDLLALLSSQWGDGAVWDAAVTRNLAASVSLRNSVELVDSDDQLAIEQQTRLLVRVRNGLDTPIRVLATATPRSPVLTFDADAQPVVIEVKPNSEATALIPTEAVSNGEVVVVMSITSETRVPVGPSKAVTVRVQAGWVTLGAFIIGGAMIVLFAIGLLRAIVRRRREAEHGGPDDGEPDDGEPDDGEPDDGEPSDDGPDTRNAGTPDSVTAGPAPGSAAG